MILRSLAQSLRSGWSGTGPMPLASARPGTLLYQMLTGEFFDYSAGGIVVNEHTAMRQSAVWTCVNIRAGLLASLPLKVYERLDRGRRVAKDHRLYKVLHDSPSREDTSYTFRHFIDASYLLSGNGYAEIIRDGANRPAALYPWPKSYVHVELGDRRGDFWYVITDRLGTRKVQPEDMLHIRGFRDYGIEGLSVIGSHARSLGLALRTEEFSKSFYDNGARSSGIIEYPSRLSDKARVNLSSSFDEKHAGVQNAGRTMILEEGAKYHQLTIPPNEAQFIETRRFSRAEIAGIFRVPTMLVPGADDTPPTYASSESFMRYIVDFTLRDDLTAWQQEINSKLFSDSDYYAEFDVDDLLRADSVARAQFHKAMWEVGAKSQNEIRADENENPIEGGDRYYIPANNFVPVDRVDDVIDAQIKPKSTPVPASSMPGRSEVSPSYRIGFEGLVKEKDAWKDFTEEKAYKKFLPFFRGIAADKLGEGRGEEFVEQYARSFAKRAKSLNGDSIEAELNRAISEISAHGGDNVRK